MAADEPAARERYLTRGTARLYVREIGRGEPIVVLHGGPDFDHEYLLPDMDRLADSFRLVYYDQRGRGRSFSGRPADEVDLAGEIDDLDAIRGVPRVRDGRRSSATPGGRCSRWSTRPAGPIACRTSS